METNAHINITWLVVSIAIILNIIFFQRLYANVSTYADKVTSTRSATYELDDL